MQAQQDATAVKMPIGDDDDDFRFWRYEDLLERRIVTSRTDLGRKQRLHGFPKARKLQRVSNATALFPINEVKAWVKLRMEESAK